MRNWAASKSATLPISLQGERIRVSHIVPGGNAQNLSTPLGKMLRFDPVRLKAYGESYQYDPKRWSFLTGPAEKISELARQAGVSYEPDAGTFNHNFRTLILDASGQLQMVFPTSGDLSDQIVSEIRRATDATNQPALQKSARENGFPVKSL